MSIVSDITSTFSNLVGGKDFVINSYPNPQDIVINIYGILERGSQQQNSVAIKPLENSNFTTDSVQIKPYIQTIRGVIYPDSLLFTSGLLLNYRDLEDYIASKILELRGYTNSPQLFSLSDLYAFGIYQPIKLFGLNEFVNQDITIPEVTLSFMQVQSTNATNYNTTNTNIVPVQPQNTTRT